MPTAAGDLVCVIRGGGDLATGVAWRLTCAGAVVVVVELAAPLTVRRTVALSTAVTDGEVAVEGLIGRLAATPDEALAVTNSDRGRTVGVAVNESLPALATGEIDVVIDARLAKRNLDTTIDDAPLVVALGPGFEAGADCDAIVETMRGHHLGRVLWSGSAAPNTGVPGVIGGRGSDRVLRAPVAGAVTWACSIGDLVRAAQCLGTIDGARVVAPFDGVVRGAIASGVTVEAGVKIGDVDPRVDPSACWEISDKALAIGGGVVEAVLSWPNRSR